ncbi:putative sulfate exporter family transporter [Roseateles sp. BYS78W]|uniref:Sulfate exporter family transporter n=1 Tax=Pelomonas candidula TaxID=3299025 RepID=A0ABW7HH07_9BURK
MTPALPLQGLAATLRGRTPGVLVAAALALAASWIAGGLGDPLARNPVLVAMLLGLLLGNVFGCPDALRPGLDFTKRFLLRTGIVLLGFRITVALLGDLGLAPILIAATELVLMLLIVRWVALRVFRLEPALALLVAAGSAVCGAAAILSVAAMAKDRERHAGIAIALITMVGTVALLLYPMAFLAGWMPGLDERSFGVLVGASIFEQAQVYGASFAVSEGALNMATLVKLSKVVMLIPLLLLMGVAQRRAPSGEARGRLPVPWFVFAFLAVLLFNSVVTVHPQVRAAVLQFDQFLFLMVMVALGLTTPLKPLVGSGGLRLIGAGVFALVLSAGIAYALVRANQGSALAEETSARAVPPGDGARIFDAVGCVKCHVPSLRGVNGDVPVFSDLLLHDMGPALDDKIVQGQAIGSEWRTTPLIGIRLRERYLHDGRATTLRDAVLEHGGEAELVRRRFFELDEDEQRAVYAFVASL